MTDMDLRFRQIHLDFHTSEAIEGIGSAFDPAAFAETLSAARVDSVTCFARGHHGWLYYPSEQFPERIHPHLDRPNLLGEQIDACHRRDIRVPIYVTVQWDQYTSQRRPDWCQMNPDGSLVGTEPLEAGFYRTLCLNTPYVEFLHAHVREILDTMDVDGLFFDILNPQNCCCFACRSDMLARGLDPADAGDRRAFGVEVLSRFKNEMTAMIRTTHPEITVFYNAGHIATHHRQSMEAYSHYEVESLPSGGWGYLHFPLTGRYARSLGKPVLGMTGKFHTFWGDFHSFKNPEALQFELFHMLALGARCSVGDQLHPDGRICPHTYERIGSVYRQVEALEPWVRGARPVVDLAVINPEPPADRQAISATPAGFGAVRMLQELAMQFDVVDGLADLSGYKLVILPDDVEVDDALKAKLSAYLAGGGAVIASHRSGLAPGGERFALGELGIEFLGDAPFGPDFIVPTGEIGQGLAATEHVMYLRALEVEPDGAEVLSRVNVPYFNREWRHFCSHRHTPSSRQGGYPAVTRKGRAIYFAHPIFRQYHDSAPRWCRHLLANAIGLLLDEPLVRHDGPSSLIVALNRQVQPGRDVLHLLHYVPERRGRQFDVIDDIIPLHELTLSLRADRPWRQARVVPAGQALDVRTEGGRCHLTLPRLDGHAVIELT
jgi:hypothetical protein